MFVKPRILGTTKGTYRVFCRLCVGQLAHCYDAVCYSFLAVYQRLHEVDMVLVDRSFRQGESFCHICNWLIPKVDIRCCKDKTDLEQRRDAYRSQRPYHAGEELGIVVFRRSCDRAIGEDNLDPANSPIKEAVLE